MGVVLYVPLCYSCVLIVYIKWHVFWVEIKYMSFIFNLANCLSSLILSKVGQDAGIVADVARYLLMICAGILCEHSISE